MFVYFKEDRDDARVYGPFKTDSIPNIDDDVEFETFDDTEKDTEKDTERRYKRIKGRVMYCSWSFNFRGISVIVNYD